jgi:hypothetical protein
MKGTGRRPSQVAAEVRRKAKRKEANLSLENAVEQALNRLIPSKADEYGVGDLQKKLNSHKLSSEEIKLVAARLIQ